MKIELLKRRLEQYLEAERKILLGQEYEIGERRLRRADLSEVRSVIDDLSAQIELAELKSGRRKQVTLL